MKKFFSLILVICMCFSCYACAKDEEPNNNISTNNTNNSNNEEHNVDTPAPETEASKPTKITKGELQYPAQNEEWEYDVYENAVVLKDYLGKSEIVYIPETLEDLPVIELYGGDATKMNGCFSYSKIKTVYLSKNLQTVDGFAHSSVENIVFADDELLYFGFWTFWECDNIQNIDDIIAHIAGTCFPAIFTYSQSDALYSITIPDRFTTIDSFAFEGCSKLRILDIGNVEKVWNSAFEKTSLEELVVHNKDCVFVTFISSVYTDNLTVKGLAGSTVARLASKYNLPFEIIEE